MQRLGSYVVYQPSSRSYFQYIFGLPAIEKLESLLDFGFRQYCRAQI
jgi:hypothetical protein